MISLFLGGDTHSGSKVGLTPPRWQDSELQEEMWRWFEEKVKWHQPFDVAIWNGDMIEGKASRIGATTLITADRREQCLIAKEPIILVNAKENYFTYGTGYHTGKGEDWEEVLAVDMIGGEIKGHWHKEFEGVPFSIRHKIGTSSIPHGRYTQIAKQYLWDTQWALLKKQHQLSRVILRSHVHYHVHAGKKGPDWWQGIVLPSLQALGSKFGERECDGVVDFGFCWMEVHNGKLIDWDAETKTLETTLE